MEKKHRKKGRAIAFTLASLMSAAVMAFSGCAVSLTCISHIDKDVNGKCDNCGTKMVIVNPNINKIEITKTPEKTYYAFNGQLDYSDGELKVLYKDGTSETVPFTDERVTVTAPGMSSAGKKFVMVAFDGVTAKYQIEVGIAKFTVKFDLGYAATSSVPNQFVASAGHAELPVAPEREGFDFAGWYKDSQFTTPFSFETDTIMADTTVYARWAGKIVVIYDDNYAGGNKVNGYTLNGKLDTNQKPTREGFTFGGWYEDAGCKTRVDLNAEITATKTVYANWISDSAELRTVTFNVNYGEEPETSEQKVANGQTVSAPATPTRASVGTKGHQAQDFTFEGWYEDAECTTEYDFDNAVTGDMELYAKWTGTYIFEAEHVNLTGKVGVGASGGANGPDMVDSVPPAAVAMNGSNGYYLTYLYSKTLFITFEIESDRDVDDATFIFRITNDAGQGKFALAPQSCLDTVASDGETPIATYAISVNGKAIDYDVIEILDTDGSLWPDSDTRRPFSDHVLTTSLSLKKGKNTFVFIAPNDVPAGGTRTTTAPVIDCIKIKTSANLTWDPWISNEVGQ